MECLLSLWNFLWKHGRPKSNGKEHDFWPGIALFAMKTYFFCVVVVIYQFIKMSIFEEYGAVKLSNQHAWANSLDPDQTPQNAASDQGLHCLPLIQQF